MTKAADGFRREGERLILGLRVRLNAPPVDGAANQALIELLSGETGREKRVAIDSPRILPPPLPPR